MDYLTELYNSDRKLWISEIQRIGKLLYGNENGIYGAIQDKINDKWFIIPSCDCKHYRMSFCQYGDESIHSMVIPSSIDFDFKKHLP